MVGEELRLAGSTFGPYEFWPGPLNEDGTLPNPLHLDQVWTDARGRLRLSDQPMREALKTAADATPRLEVAVAFPFSMPDGRYLLEEPLHVADPEADGLVVVGE